jgi:ribonuclease HI
MRGEITIYTDGASRGNPGPGGYGVILLSGKHRLEKAEGYRLTTNNRMELMAVIAGLEALKVPGSHVVICTDSKYVADSVEKGWVFQWESKAFKKKKNSDLWIRFLRIYRQHKVRFVWIKGHANNPENERCDYLAVEATRGSNLTEDTGYNPGEENTIIFGDPD